MKIVIIGATGHLGNATAREAKKRGHQITSLNRASMDVTDADSITAAVAGHDAVIVAVKGPNGLVARAAEALLQALPAAAVTRLVFLGGGGSLRAPDGQRFVDSPSFPAQYRQTANDQAEALRVLRTAVTVVKWSYVSPPPIHLVPGDKTGRYRAEARETPLTDAAGESRISVGDYAAAVVDAVENASFIRQRFTTAY